ncbi:hypothetical protein Dsin_031445 [Dipteronia sinensis]|uniref:PGG domain-containing protein n=1 Tax=Dipteronia sinensis TaxID=43782 RepID=A0AAE0DSC8_9ROSI|nr:hypothetical protein Dsin_031445 [Dipteronia sinensis]
MSLSKLGQRIGIVETWDQRIDGNDGNLEASGKVELKSSEKANEFQKMMTLAILYMYHELYRRLFPELLQRLCIRCGRNSILSTKSSVIIKSIKSKGRLSKQELNNRIHNLMVVAALIAGAAFSGVLQMPFSADKEGTDDEKSMVGRFMFANMFAMNLSITAALTLCLALLVDNKLAAILVWVAFVLLELALSSVGSTFWWAMQIRYRTYKLHHIEANVFSFVSIRTVSIVFIYVQGALIMIPLLTSTMGWQVLPLFIYFIFFCFYFLLHWSRSFFSRLLKTILKYGLLGLLFLLIICLGVYSLFH